MFWIWSGFVLLVLVLLALDLFVFHRKAHEVKVKEALGFSAFWIALALIFNVVVYFAYEGHWLGLGRAADGTVAIDPVDKQPLNGASAAAKFFTGYVLEKSLSVDNLFVIALIFGYFAIPNIYQHRVLFWGIVGALVMRGVMIALGAALVDRFEWILYIFGLILLYTAYKMIAGGAEPDPQNNPVIRFFRRFFPVTHEIHGPHFAVRESELRAGEHVDPPEGDATSGAAPAAPTAPPAEGVVPVPGGPAEQAGLVPPQPVDYAKPSTGRWVLTPLAMALVVVETTDLIFAVDSIPAIFGVTADPFIVFTSNIFAILGLRSLYFALAGILDKFEYLKVSLAAILALVGVKMLASHWLHKIPGISYYLLLLVALILGAGILASVVAARRREAKGQTAWTATPPADAAHRPPEPPPSPNGDHAAAPGAAARNSAGVADRRG